MSLWSYLTKRIGFMAVTLFFVTVMTFAITHILPGNVAVLILGKNASPERVHALKQQLGLTQPLWIQYIDWLGDLAHGNLGQSLRYGQPVEDLIAERLPRSMLLALSAVTISIFLSIPLGVIAAVKRNEGPDLAASMFGFIGISIPVFLWGIVLVMVFAVWIDIFPTGDYVNPLQHPVAGIRHLVLPASALGFALTAYIMRMTRSSMLEVLGEEYVKFARAKGMSERVVILRHALQNAIIPTITVIAFQFAYAFGGVVVLEKVFYWPGIGQLTLIAIQNRDIPLLQGCIIVIAIIYMLSNLMADVLYAYFDPRIRYGGGE